MAAKKSEGKPREDRCIVALVEIPMCREDEITAGPVTHINGYLTREDAVTLAQIHTKMLKDGKKRANGGEITYSIHAISVLLAYIRENAAA